MSKEELSTEEQRELIVKNTLESIVMQTAVGSNLVRSNPYEYGQLGTQSAEEAYQEGTQNKEFLDTKQKLSQQKKSQYKQQGIYGDANVSDPEVYSLMVQQLQEVMGMAKLGELEKYTKAAGADLKFEVPEELKEFSYMTLMKSLSEKGAISQEGGLDQSKLNKDEQNALGMYQTLDQAYKRACTLKSSQGGYFNEINQMGTQIAEQYKKEEPKK